MPPSAPAPHARSGPSSRTAVSRSRACAHVRCDLTVGGHGVRLVEAVLGGVVHRVGSEVDDRSTGHREVDDHGGEVGDKGIGGMRALPSPRARPAESSKAHGVRGVRVVADAERVRAYHQDRVVRRPTRPRSARHSAAVGTTGSGRPSRHVGANRTTRRSPIGSDRRLEAVREPCVRSSLRGSAGRARRCAARPGPRPGPRGGRRLPVSRGTTSGDAAGIRPIREVPRRYMADMSARTGPMPPRTGSLIAAGLSRCIRLSGLPCQRLTTRAPRLPKRLASPNPCVTTMTSARSARQKARHEPCSRTSAPRARASAPRRRTSEPRHPGRRRSGQCLDGQGAGTVVHPEGAPDDP